MLVIRLFTYFCLLAVCAACAADTLSVEDRNKARRDLNILLGLDENKGIIKPGNGPDSNKAASLNLASPLYQKGLQIYEAALTAYMQGDYARAVYLLKQVIELDPLHKDAFTYMLKAQDLIRKAEDPEGKLQAAETIQGERNELLFQQGLHKYVNNDFSGALEFWQKLIQQAPYFTKAFKFIKMAEIKQNEIVDNFLNQGLFYYQQGDVSKAMAEWKKGLRYAPDDERLKSQFSLAEQQSTLAVAEITRQADESMRTGKLADAVRIFSEALEKFPDNVFLEFFLQKTRAASQETVEKKFKEAQALHDSHKYGQAVAVLKEALALNPDYLPGSQLLELCEKKADQERQRATLKEFFDAGMEALAHGRFYEALDNFTMVREKDPAYPNLSEQMKKAQEAMKGVEERKDLTITFNKGLDYYSKGYYESALREWEQISAKDPDNEIVKQYIQTLKGRMQEAKELQKKKTLDEKKAFDLNNRAIEFYRKKNFRESYKVIQEATELDPENTSIRKGLVAARKEVLKADEANQPATERKANELFHKGITFYRNGEYAKAIECWKKVVECKPDHQKAQKYIESVSQKLAKIEKI